MQMTAQGDQAMKTISIAVLSAAALMVATSASALAQNLARPSTSQVMRTPFFPPEPQRGVPQSRPLLTIGKVEVHMWAPVEQPYNANANRNLAADPVWAEP
jgi:hypothetical protein